MTLLIIGGMTPIFSHYIILKPVPAVLGLFAYFELRLAKLTKS